MDTLAVLVHRTRQEEWLTHDRSRLMALLTFAQAYYYSKHGKLMFDDDIRWRAGTSHSYPYIENVNKHFDCGDNCSTLLHVDESVCDTKQWDTLMLMDCFWPYHVEYDYQWPVLPNTPDNSIIFEADLLWWVQNEPMFADVDKLVEARKQAKQRAKERSEFIRQHRVHQQQLQ